MEHKLLIILAGYGFDLAMGDPQWNWHPVRLIGRLIGALEKRLNNVKRDKFFAGIILVIIVVGVTVSCVWLSLRLAKFFSPVFYYIYSALLIYFSLSVKALAQEAKEVYNALKNKHTQQARKNLSMIVGRDTDRLDEPEIIRATVESIAESIMDGIVAPLFYVFLGGPVLVWAYKAINTLDSMVGYRNQRFIEFGKFSAKLDGLANFIPAKITCFLITVSSWFYRKDWYNSARWSFHFFFKGQENNSTATEAAMAGALRIQLGGLNFYDSVPITKPFLGDGISALETRHIQESINIAYLCSFLFVLIGLFLINLIGGR